MGEAKQRSVAIDVVRIMGVAAVATGHMFSAQEFVRMATFSWQVPIFFFLTGYLWTRGRPLSREVSTRAKSLLLPYACWTVIFGLPLLAFTTWNRGFPGESLGLTLWGGGLVRGAFAPYWFLPMLFFVAVLLRAMERFPRWMSWATAILGLGVTYAFGSTLMQLPHDVFFTLPCMLFALVGQEVRRAEPRIPHKGIIGSALLVIAFALFLLGLIRPLDIKLGDFGTPAASFVASLAICVGLVFFTRAVLDGRQIPAAGLITELALVSVVVLLTHTFVFVVFGRMGITDPITLALTVIVCWSCALIIHRTRLSVPFAGVTRLSTSQRARQSAPAPS